ncbi:histidine kinase-like ATPase [Vibrio phage 1.084.O._10N.261.49.F5]|nr:histidine kinase-like ATPase [Vibrio phage 1.084.O._10N.261.49.F5]
MAIPKVVKSEVNVGRSSRSEVCKMEFNASVVKAVTSNLYDFKIEAVVREYSTNITDIHSDSGMSGVAGYVHIPTKMNPVIKFIDYGCGMNEDDIYGTFTVLGKSTKRGDNTTNGSLGFGSKAYGTVSDMMTVISVKNGVKTVVVCYKDKHGMLSADTKSITETEESNGTTIEIPVELSKVEQWQKTAALVLGAFRVPHENNGFGDYQNVFEDMKSVCKTVREKGSILLQTGTYASNSHRSSKLVLMGDVAYHLPSFEDFIVKTKISQPAKQVLDSGFYMTHFEIGDLDHAPSREAISYDTKTFTQVKHRVNRDIIKYYRTEFSDILKGDWNIYKFYKKFKDTALWNSLSNFKLPFTKGYRLQDVNPDYTYTGKYAGSKFEPLLGKVSTFKGFILNASLTGAMYSGSIESISHYRLCKIDSPVFLFRSEGTREYKVKQMLENQPANNFYVDTEANADYLLNWFGCGEKLCCDSIMPEPTKRNKTGKGVSRGTFGIKEDWETIGQVQNILKGETSTWQQKVNLQESGVFYCDKPCVALKAFDKTFSFGTTRMVEFLKHVGADKIIFENKNNSGKIKRSGVKHISVAIEEYVKSHKSDFIKYYSKEEPDLGLTQKSLLIAKRLPAYKKFSNKVTSSCEAPVHLKVIRNVSTFGFENTKLWQQERNRVIKLRDAVETAVEKKVSKLPLFHCIPEKDMEYYLRLEKVIK